MSRPALAIMLRDYRAAEQEEKQGANPDARRTAHAEVIRLGGEIAQHGVWVFNRDFHDLAQIIPFIEDYWAICEELKADGKRPYDDTFIGRIPGLENALPREETPIYLLQQLRRLVEGHELLARVLDDGYVRLTDLSAQERFASVVVFDQFYSPQRFQDARVQADAENKPVHLLPKGKRTHGRRLGALDQVYVRRT